MGCPWKLTSGHGLKQCTTLSSGNNGFQPTQEKNETDLYQTPCCALPFRLQLLPRCNTHISLLTRPASQKNALYSLSNYQLHIPWKKTIAQTCMIQNIIVRLKAATIKKFQSLLTALYNKNNDDIK